MSFQSSLDVLSDEAPTWEVIELLRALSSFILHIFVWFGELFLTAFTFIRFYTEIGKLVNKGRFFENILLLKSFPR